MATKREFRIIIIDDNIDIHKDFLKILGTTSSESSSELEAISTTLFGEKTDKPLLPMFNIDTATQGEQGVEMIAKAMKEGRAYALAFVDIRMPPGWDGIETIKHIWEIDKDMQVVICTAHSDYSWEETIAQLGQSPNLLILKKPFDQTAVRQLACALTQKWQLMQEAREYTTSLESTIEERTKELKHQATHDALTGLPNRVLLQDRIKQAIETSKRNNQLFAVLFFDLDRFKLVNDSLSHTEGDTLLVLMAERLSSELRKVDTIARLGGDEFVVIATELKEPASASYVANTILNTVKKPMNISGHEIALSTSIGIALYPQDAKNFSDLLKNADSAMYAAKAAGGDGFRFYSEQMNEASLARLEIESDLRQAIKRNEFILYYQPQYNTDTNTLNAVEALIRWQHPTKGLLLPIDFILIAEKNGLIVPIGTWVLKEACRQNKQWQKEGFPPIRIAVNITTQQLQTDFVKTVESVLKETGLEPKYLELELNENTIINNNEAIETINQLKNLGVMIALDDFGTGYSSLNYLRTLALDRLKIDHSFIKNIEINTGDEVIIRAIIAMAHGLNFDILAEGVENQTQLEFLKKQTCNEIQGFYFSKPLPPKELENLLKNPTKKKSETV